MSVYIYPLDELWSWSIIVLVRQDDQEENIKDAMHIYDCLDFYFSSKAEYR